MDAQFDILESLKKLWKPDMPLPTLPILRKMVGQFGIAWEEPNLHRDIKVGYNPRLRTTLGRAALNSMRIELNPRLLIDHPVELIPTLGHELAHLVAHRRFGNVSPHGLEFQTLMRSVGLSSRATHDLPVAHLRRKRTRGKYLYLHRCSDCGNSFVAASTRRNCYCKLCGPDMSWDIYRLPNTPAGQNILEQLLKNN